MGRTLIALIVCIVGILLLAGCALPRDHPRIVEARQTAQQTIAEYAGQPAPAPQVVEAPMPAADPAPQVVEAPPAPTPVTLQQAHTGYYMPAPSLPEHTWGTLAEGTSVYLEGRAGTTWIQVHAPDLGARVWIEAQTIGSAINIAALPDLGGGQQ